MKKLMDVLPLLLVVVLLFGTACQSNKKKDAESVNVTLFDKDLPEIKTLVNGEWELVSGKNAVSSANMRILSSSLQTTNMSGRRTGKAEPGGFELAQSGYGAGYEAYLMDVFYETNPAYPVSIKGDTLILQDCSETGYKYTLVRK